MAASDFEVNKTSGVGPTSIMVHPIQANETEVDKTATLVVQVGEVSKSVSLTQKANVVPVETWETHFQIEPSTKDLLFDGTKTGEGKNPGKLTLKTTSKNNTYEVDSLGFYHSKEKKAYLLVGWGVGEDHYITLNLTQSGGRVETQYLIEPIVDIGYSLPNTPVIAGGFRYSAYEVNSVNGVEVNRQARQFMIPTIHNKFTGILSPPGSSGTIDAENHVECWVENISNDPSVDFIDDMTCDIWFKAEKIGLFGNYIHWPAKIKDALGSPVEVEDGLMVNPYYVVPV